ncbi:hypothetical protein ACPCSP_33770 [Streptomyces cinereoruber]|uniref:hypothetical protein n=1 Tax=Streptomyces cinereoruber TaxID=67260 RepID=UPI003C2D1101
MNANESWEAVPIVNVRLWRADAIVLFDWLMSTDLNAVPITHPDMEVVQYRQAQAPRFIARDQMNNVDGLDSINGLRDPVDGAWTDGKCTRGC